MWLVATWYVSDSLRTWESQKIGWEKKLNWKNFTDKLKIEHPNTTAALENMKNGMAFPVTCSIVKKFQYNGICSLWLNCSSNSGIQNGINPLSHICINHHRMGKTGAVSFHKGFYSSREHGWAGGARGHCHFQGLKRMMGIVQCVGPEPRLQNKVFLFWKMWRRKKINP